MKPAVLVGVVSVGLLSACTGIGQLAVRDERNEYNDVISDTTTQQLLKNIVKSHFYEPPSFFDVVEVDQTKTAQASVTGGSTNIGAALVAGSVSPTFSVEDSPILKYQPPSSAGYIQQILQPIPLESIANLNNSNANLSPLLALSVNALTPTYLGYDRSVDLIDFLDMFGAINTDPLPDGRLRITKRPGGFLTPNASASLQCFVRFKPKGTSVPTDVVNKLWDKLAVLFGQPGAPSIVLRAPATKIDKKVEPREGSIVLARAAIGALRESESPHEISFIPRQRADQLRKWNDVRLSPCANGEYYYVGRSLDEISEKWNNRVKYAFDETNTQSEENERALGATRASILVETSGERPDDAYVSIFRSGVWYSIDDHDIISKMNFELLGELLQIQAKVPQVPATPTVISATH